MKGYGPKKSRKPHNRLHWTMKQDTNVVRMTTTCVASKRGLDIDASVDVLDDELM
ncbi:hypothetical protein HanLR1_Chr05g0167321 [Helianthus annuus]|nr:hypothetical protein HanLR1_Chr05g0167321 [Helianthus annuus]